MPSTLSYLCPNPGPHFNCAQILFREAKPIQELDFYGLAPRVAFAFHAFTLQVCQKYVKWSFWPRTRLNPLHATNLIGATPQASPFTNMDWPCYFVGTNRVPADSQKRCDCTRWFAISPNSTERKKFLKKRLRFLLRDKRCYCGRGQCSIIKINWGSRITPDKLTKKPSILVWHTSLTTKK